MFGQKHLIILAICAVGMVLLTLFTRKWPLQKLAKWLLVVGIASELIKVFYYIVANEETYGGILPKTDLPFHLCSIQIIFVAVLVYSNSQRLKELLLSFMLPSCLFGGLAALLIPTNSSLTGGWILSVQYFGYHTAISVFSLVLLFGDQFQRTVRHYVNCLKFLVVLMLFAIYINSVLYDGVSNINFMYVASPPQEGLPFLTEKYGWPVYMAHYGCLVVFCVTICYIRPIIAALRRKKTPV
jgi:hypothetical integral membrane protein (TIGR02206 family)